MKRNTNDNDFVAKACSSYEEYYNKVLVKEQPFYHTGISTTEIAKELQYLNENLDAFYKGNYMPLWKQNLYH